MNLSSLIFINLGWVGFMEPGVLSNTQHNITWLIGWLNSGQTLTYEMASALVYILLISTLYGVMLTPPLEGSTWKSVGVNLGIKFIVMIFNFLLGAFANVYFNFALTFSLYEPGASKSLILLLLFSSLAITFMKGLFYLLEGESKRVMFFLSFISMLLMSVSAFLLGVELTSPFVLSFLILPFGVEEGVKLVIEKSESVEAFLSEKLSLLNYPKESNHVFSYNWSAIVSSSIVFMIILNLFFIYYNFKYSPIQLPQNGHFIYMLSSEITPSQNFYPHSSSFIFMVEEAKSLVPLPPVAEKYPSLLEIYNGELNHNLMSYKEGWKGNYRVECSSCGHHYWLLEKKVTFSWVVKVHYFNPNE